MPGAAPAGPGPGGFPPQCRIRKRPEFNAVFEGGQRVHSRFFTFLIRTTTLATPRLGIVASRKFGGAVQRNRAKRLIREMFREQLRLDRGGPAVDLVVIPKRELIQNDFVVVSRDFRNTWRRARERAGVGRRE